jgi:GTPase SAR1 family protein
MRVLSLMFVLFFTPHGHVVVYGMAGAGKSSLIRALCGIADHAIRVSSDGDGTLHSTQYDCAPINRTVTDTPGFGTRQFPMVHSFPRDMSLALLVVSSRLYTQYYEFVERYMLLIQVDFRPPLILVRTQTDIHPTDPSSTASFYASELYNVPRRLVECAATDGESMERLRQTIINLS